MTVKEKLKHHDLIKKYEKLDDVICYALDKDVDITDEELLQFRLIVRKIQNCYVQQIKKLKEEGS